jgi:uncharacterized phage infection (PIP) family protein YhgE
VAEAIRAITESAAKVRNLVEEVNEASRQQAQGIDQAATAITQVSEVTQRAAASAEEGAAASEELSAQSQTVKSLVQALRSLVDSGGAGLGSVLPRRNSTSVRSQAMSDHSSKSAEEMFPMETSGKGGFESF